MTREQIALERAEQQILGFYHRENGGDIVSLIEGMGLTEKEYLKMKKEGMIDYLPEKLKEEIAQFFKEI